VTGDLGRESRQEQLLLIAGASQGGTGDGADRSLEADVVGRSPGKGLLERVAAGKGFVVPAEQMQRHCFADEVAMSSFMVLGPTTKQDWVTAVGVVVGIVVSFILVKNIDSLDTLTIVWAIFPAIAMATFGVSIALALSAYTTQMMMTIVLLGGDYDAFALDSSNRLVAEVIGIALAVAASFFLQWWATQRQVTSFALPEATEGQVAGPRPAG
jgi:hypothetical protein